MRITNLIWVFLMVFIVSSCGTTQRVGVLRSPDHKDGSANANPQNTDPSKSKVEEKSPEDAKNAGKISREKTIALVLPFQLNKVTPSSLDEEDIKRSALALDFYQGFQLGLDQLASTGNVFALEVLDSRDDVGQNTALARSEQVKNSGLIVGPVYPQEIKSFGASSDKSVLQVNPLAATMPTEFNLPNLVSVTPPISVHMRAISAQVVDRYSPGDVVIIYNTSNSDHRQFINGFLQDIQERLQDVDVRSVSNVSQLNEYLTNSRVNHIITGTTDKFQIKELLDNLDQKYIGEAYQFKLYGHPLWDRFDFSPYRNFSNYQPLITSENHLNDSASGVRKFDKLYKDTFKVTPSDHAYKGYDAGIYFGTLLTKYGQEYPEYLTQEPFEGLYSTYKFNHNERWGYVNFGVSLKMYRGGSFQVK